MTEYTDIDEVNALMLEQSVIAQALTILDNGGTIASCVISQTATSGPGVNVPLTDPAQALTSGVTAGLRQRYNAINRELEALGIENVPPNWSGGPPAAETQPA